MTDSDKLFSMNKKEYIESLNLTEILPIDNVLLFNGVKYQLTNFDMKTLNLHRISMGYDWNYSGPEKNKGDAEEINSMLLAALGCIRSTISNHIEHNCLEYKIIK